MVREQLTGLGRGLHSEFLNKWCVEAEKLGVGARLWAWRSHNRILSRVHERPYAGKKEKTTKQWSISTLPVIYTKPGASLETAPAGEGRKPSDLSVHGVLPLGSAFARHPDQFQTKRRPRIGTPTVQQHLATHSHEYDHFRTHHAADRRPVTLGKQSGDRHASRCGYLRL